MAVLAEPSHDLRPDESTSTNNYDLHTVPFLSSFSTEAFQAAGRIR
jgi:hypothetical protein